MIENGYIEVDDGSRRFPVATRTSNRLSSRRPPVQVTAEWGWAEIPAEVKRATALTAIDHFREEDLMHVAGSYGGPTAAMCDPSAGLFGRKMRFAQMGGLGVTPEAVDREVRVLVDKLFEIRTQAMFQGNGSAQAMPWPRPEG